MSRKRVIVVTVGIMLSLFMAAVESTVVATAMPTIVSQLGGLAFYSWVFTAYMLTSTTTVPIYGKLSDILGRKPVFMVAMALFLVGSVLCGQSQNMGQLIAFRALQGLGAGGLMPLAFIMIGDIFSFEQRAACRASSPGSGGSPPSSAPCWAGSWWITSPGSGCFTSTWCRVFWPRRCCGSAGVIPPWAPRATRLPIDFAGTVLLSVGVVALLLGLTDLQKPLGVGLIGLAAVLFVVLLWVERRAADPMLPLPLFKDRLFAVAVSQGLLAGWAMFGSTSFIPLFAQAVLGTSATAAGSVLTPMMLGWVGASIIGSRLLLRFGYRTIALAGMITLVVGTFFMTRISPHTTLPILMVNVALMGIGMGLSVPAFMIAVQSSVQRKVMGTATATLQFSRSIGGTLGVSVMGVILSTQLARNLRLAGVASAGIDLNALLSPVASAAPAVNDVLRGALTAALQSVFVAALIAAVAGLVVTALGPAREPCSRSRRHSKRPRQNCRRSSSLWLSPTWKSTPTSRCSARRHPSRSWPPAPVRMG